MPRPFGKPCAAALDGVVPQPPEQRMKPAVEDVTLITKDVSTTGVTLSRSQSNESRHAGLVTSGSRHHGGDSGLYPADDEVRTLNQHGVDLRNSGDVLKKMPATR